MAYTPQTWADLPSTTTPVSAARLSHMEVGIDTADAAASAAQATANARCLPAGDLSGSAASPTVARVNGVAITGTPTVGQVPTATSSSAATWQTVTGGGGSATLDGLTDVTVPTPVNDDVLQLKAGTWVNRNMTQFKVDLGTLNQDTTGSAAKVGGVAITGTPTAGQIPTATSGSTATWQAPSGGGGSSTLDGLTDVTVPTPVNDDVLQLKAGVWVNRSIAQLKVDLTESVQDIVGAFLVQGTGIALSYDDAANTLTINATGAAPGGNLDGGDPTSTGTGTAVDGGAA